MLGELLGVRLSLLIGDPIPLPPGPDVINALESVEVTSDAAGASGFQATFTLGRELSPDFRLVSGRAVDPFKRVVMTVVIGAIPTVISDGIITHQQVSPSSEPGESRLTISGQ